jgi:endoglucanase
MDSTDTRRRSERVFRRSLVSATVCAAPLLMQARAGWAVAPTGGAAWRSFKSRFVSQDGRVFDPASPEITHSEGQAWALLLAEHHDDREAFGRILAWTRQRLAVRMDRLLAWRYRTDAGGVVDDPNNATDADLCFAWALLRASRRWPRDGLRSAAVSVATDIRRHLTRNVGGRWLLLPGARGFEHDRFVVANPSYYVFGALDDLSSALEDDAWGRLADHGERLMRDARFGRWALTPDWVRVARQDGRVSMQPDRGERFSYDAVRVPLYLTWSRRSARGLLAPFVSFWTESAHAYLPAWTTLTDDRLSPYAAGPGIRAIASLTVAAAGRSPADLPPPGGEPDNYYHAALALLAQVAGRETGHSPAAIQSSAA